MQALARSALGNEVAAARLRGLLTGRKADAQVAEVLAGREVGFALAMAHLLGVAVARHIGQVPTVADLEFETLVARVAPAVHHHLAAPAATTSSNIRTGEIHG